MDLLLDLGEGLKIAKVQLDELKEQDLNARAMNSKMFNQLAKNIKDDKRLESLPFCALTDSGIEIVSGHHRVRASRTAGINEIYIILDDTGMSRDSIRSKQLSHNSLQGTDNEQLVKQIYEMIDDAEAKVASFVGGDYDLDFDKLKIQDVTADLNVTQILVMFLDYEKEVFEKAVKEVSSGHDELIIAENKKAKEFKKCLERVGIEYDVRSMSTIFSVISEIVLKYLGEEVPFETHLAIRDIFGCGYVPKEIGEKIKKEVDDYQKKNKLNKSEKWQILTELVSDVDG